MTASVDSTKPMLNARTKRMSAYSQSPSLSGASVQSTTSSNESRNVDIKSIRERLARLDSAKLEGQRYSTSQEKIDYQSKLALGAKLDRALDRRLGNQDAVMRPRMIKEKA